MTRQRLPAAVLVAAAMIASGCGQDAPPKAAEPHATPAPSTSDAPLAPGDTQAPGPEPSAAPDSPPPAQQLLEPESEVAKLPEIVARIDGEAITGKEFGLDLDFSLKRMRLMRMPLELNDEQRRQLLEDVVNAKVLGILAQRAGIEVTNEEVHAEFERRKAMLPSEEYYRQHLENTQRTEEQLLEALRVRMTKEKYVEANTGDLAATDEEVAAEYERLKATGDMERPVETVDFSHILIRVDAQDEADWAQAKKKIDAARARVVAGEGFGDLARELSEDAAAAERGGFYPEARREAMPPELADYVFSAPLNETSEPLRTHLGWHIVTVTARHEPGTMALEDVKTPLRKVVLDYKRRKRVQELVDEAKKSMNIEYLYPVPEAAGPTPP